MLEARLGGPGSTSLGRQRRPLPGIAYTVFNFRLPLILVPVLIPPALLRCKSTMINSTLFKTYRHLITNPSNEEAVVFFGISFTVERESSFLRI